MIKAVFQSYTLVQNSEYKNAFEWSLRSWSEWCKRWGVRHYVRMEKYNYGDTQFLNQMKYEPNNNVVYDLGVLCDCYTLIHPMLHPNEVFSSRPYVNVNEDGTEYISIISGDMGCLASIDYVDREKHGERTLLERDAAILDINEVSDRRCNSFDLSSVSSEYKLNVLQLLTFQPSIVRFGNEKNNKYPNIFWTKTCNFELKSLYCCL